MNISIIVDNPRSWFLPFAQQLCDLLTGEHHAEIRGAAGRVPPGNEIAFFLSCEEKVTPELLARSRHNIVVHASDLPKGKGMSPLTWQILEGKNDIPICLFEAVAAIDAGDVYLKDTLHLQGTELLGEMQSLLGGKIIEMCERFARNYPNILVQARAQVGIESRYRRRSPTDSRLDPNKTIVEQFNLLRVVDNKRYPAYFEWKGRKFVIKINGEV